MSLVAVARWSPPLRTVVLTSSCSTMFFGKPLWSFMSHPSGLGPVVTNVARLQSELDFLLKLETKKRFLYLLAFLARGWAIRRSLCLCCLLLVPKQPYIPSINPPPSGPFPRLFSQSPGLNETGTVKMIGGPVHALPSSRLPIVSSAVGAIFGTSLW